MFNDLYAFWADWRIWVYSDPLAYAFVCMMAGLFLTATFVHARDLIKSLRSKGS
jgi:hypothetical protein